MKHILMIGTGGTIASEMSPDGLTPEISSEQLLAAVPRIGELCEVDCLQLYSLDSTSLRPAHWQGLARAIRERYSRSATSPGSRSWSLCASAAHRTWASSP